MTGTDNYTKYLVEGLQQHVNLQERYISMDRYFTSMKISEYLLDNGMTVVPTMHSDRAGIPKEMKETKSRESPSILYAYNTDIKSVLVSYVIKAKSGVKNVLVLSSMHKNTLTGRDERKKPHVISFYDRTKGGVDVMDIMARIHTTRFKNRRWTINASAYVLDTVRTIMFTSWNEIHSDNKMGSSDFVWKLGEDLIKPRIQSRYQNVTGLQRSVVVAMKSVLEVEEDHQMLQKKDLIVRDVFILLNQ